MGAGVVGSDVEVGRSVAVGSDEWRRALWEYGVFIAPKCDVE